MSAVSWPAFLLSHGHVGHLVVAVVTSVGADEVGSLRLRAIRDLVSRVLRSYDLAGAYALTVSRASGFPEILCVFEETQDADVFAVSVHAGATDRYPEWATQRTFRLDEAMEGALAASLLSDGEIDQR